MAFANKINFGAGFTVVDEGNNEITVSSSGGGDSGGGIQFDTSPQPGDWFYAELTGGSGGGPNGWGWEVVDDIGNGVVFNGVPFFAGDINEASNGALFGLTGSGFRFDLTNTQSFNVCLGYNGGRALEITNSSGVNQIGFFGATPVAQQSAPVTLGDVIAAGSAYGLWP